MLNFSEIYTFLLMCNFKVKWYEKKRFQIKIFKKFIKINDFIIFVFD